MLAKARALRSAHSLWKSEDGRESVVAVVIAAAVMAPVVYRWVTDE